jgi:hypothetical protein|tara:strand:- start:185 stop:376 length:192 start_codon:yes stop_codon:yes gene_type:complete
MKDITGYNYIDEPATKLLTTLSTESQKNLLKIFKQIYSAGKSEGYHYGIKNEKINLEEGYIHP